MQCYGEFDDAEPGAKMAAGLGDRIDCLLPQFIGKLAQLLGRQRTQVAWHFDAVEQGCGRI
jgi:hypothetical protein